MRLDWVSQHGEAATYYSKLVYTSYKWLDGHVYQRQLSQMTTWAQPASTPEPAPETGGSATTDEGANPKPLAKPEPRIDYVPRRTVKFSFEKAWPADETDVDRYLACMREALMEEIRKGKRIRI